MVSPWVRNRGNALVACGNCKNFLGASILVKAAYYVYFVLRLRIMFSIHFIINFPFGFYKAAQGYISVNLPYSLIP